MKHISFWPASASTALTAPARTGLAITALALGALVTGCQSNPKQETAVSYPQAATVDSADVFFGVKVLDPYLWLENDTAENTLAWVQAENKTTNDYMAQIPFRDTIKKELTALFN